MKNPENGWRVVRGSQYERQRNRYVYEVRVKQVGPITYVGIQEVDDDADLSYLGEYATKEPDYPYYDRAANVLVTGAEDVEYTEVELCAVNKTDAWIDDVPPGGERWVATHETPHGGTIAQTHKGLLLTTIWQSTCEHGGFTPRFNELEQSESRKIAWDHSIDRKRVDGKLEETIKPFRATDYDPDAHEMRQEARYIGGFQHGCLTPDGTVNLDEVAYCIADTRRLEDYGNGWSMCGIRVIAKVGCDPDGNGGEELEDSGCGGIESDSDDSYFWGEVADDQLAELDPETLLKRLNQQAEHYGELAAKLQAYAKELRTGDQQ